MTLCHTKRKYRDEIHAKTQLAKIAWKDDGRSLEVPTRAYRCPICNRWHLTSKPYDASRSKK